MRKGVIKIFIKKGNILPSEDKHASSKTDIGTSLLPLIMDPDPSHSSNLDPLSSHWPLRNQPPHD